MIIYMRSWSRRNLYRVHRNLRSQSRRNRDCIRGGSITIVFAAYLSRSHPPQIYRDRVRHRSIAIASTTDRSWSHPPHPHRSITIAMNSRSTIASAVESAVDLPSPRWDSCVSVLVPFRNNRNCLFGRHSSAFQTLVGIKVAKSKQWYQSQNHESENPHFLLIYSNLELLCYFFYLFWRSTNWMCWLICFTIYVSVIFVTYNF